MSEDRDADIVRRALDGETYDSIAKDWRISKVRALQIALKNGVPRRQREKSSEPLRTTKRAPKAIPLPRWIDPPVPEPMAYNLERLWQRKRRKRGR